MYKWRKNFKFITGFRNSHGTKHSLLTILQKQKNSLDEKNIYGPAIGF